MEQGEGCRRGRNPPQGILQPAMPLALNAGQPVRICPTPSRLNAAHVVGADVLRELLVLAAGHEALGAEGQRVLVLVVDALRGGTGKWRKWSWAQGKGVSEEAGESLCSGCMPGCEDESVSNAQLGCRQTMCRQVTA